MYNDIINGLCKENDIKRLDICNFKQMIKFVYNTKLVKSPMFYEYLHFNGLAWMDERMIAIPKYIYSDRSFMIALHEIGHVIKGYSEDHYCYDDFIHEEAMADLYACNKAMEYSDLFDDIDKSIKRHILGTIESLKHMIERRIDHHENCGEVYDELIQLLNKYGDYDLNKTITFEELLKKL